MLKLLVGDNAILVLVHHSREGGGHHIRDIESARSARAAGTASSKAAGVLLTLRLAGKLCCNRPGTRRRECPNWRATAAGPTGSAKTRSAPERCAATRRLTGDPLIEAGEFRF
jgi:hypothetical protein